MWISLEARDHLREGALRDLLTDPANEHCLMNGSVFPDGGYVVDDDYGEIAHWEPFISGYIRWIRRSFDVPYTDGAAATHVVFLMGLAAHDMADMFFDSLFMRAARGEDASGWANGLFDSLDSASDVLLVADTGLDVTLEPWAPVDDLVAIYGELSYDADDSVIWSGQDFLQVVVQFGHDTGLNDPGRVQEYREQYPWSAAHLLDELEPGSPPGEALVVAAYWQALWDRLHGVENPENQIIATVPTAGSVGQPTDHTVVQSQVAIVFGYEVVRDTLAMTVSDQNGGEHAVEVHQWGNLVRLVPLADWPADTELTVTVEGGVETIAGVLFPDNWSFSFSTAAGAPDVPGGDPTPNTSAPSPTPDDGGCAATGGSHGLPLTLVLLFLIVLARRRFR
ncbi:MAG: Ig-like domain-containing protein [bacterium]